jgi:hypothetical protein
MESVSLLGDWPMEGTLIGHLEVPGWSASSSVSTLGGWAQVPSVPLAWARDSRSQLGSPE